MRRIYRVEVKSPGGDVLAEYLVGVLSASEDDSNLDYLYPCHNTDLAERISWVIGEAERQGLE